MAVYDVQTTPSVADIVDRLKKPVWVLLQAGELTAVQALLEASLPEFARACQWEEFVGEPERSARSRPAVGRLELAARYAQPILIRPYRRNGWPPLSGRALLLPLQGPASA